MASAVRSNWVLDVRPTADSGTVRIALAELRSTSVKKNAWAVVVPALWTKTAFRPSGVPVTANPRSASMSIRNWAGKLGCERSPNVVTPNCSAVPAWRTPTAFRSMTAKLSPGPGRALAGIRPLVPVSANTSVVPGWPLAVLLLNAKLPEPPDRVTDVAAGCTLAARCASTCQATWTWSPPPLSFTYPSTSLVASRLPLPPFGPPSSTQSLSFCGTILSCTLTVAVPRAGTVTVAGATTVTAPLAASLAYRNDGLMV